MSDFEASRRVVFALAKASNMPDDQQPKIVKPLSHPRVLEPLLRPEPPPAPQPLKYSLTLEEQAQALAASELVKKTKEKTT